MLHLTEYTVVDEVFPDADCWQKSQICIFSAAVTQ